MHFEIIRKSDIKVTEWSGGTTSELFIYPKNSDFKSGNFDIRISIATVEVEESLFTSLPNVKRTLMVLEGELTLQHKGHHSCRLKRFEQDTFSGDWVTHSYGKVTDFNVMTKNNTIASVEVIFLNPGEIISDFNANEIDFLHVLEGEINFNQSRLNAGESIAIYRTEPDENKTAFANVPVTIIRVQVK